MTVEKKSWSMRPYRPGDEEAIRELFGLVFGQELSARQWEWSYRENGTDRITITLAEGEDGELAGQYALRPVRMKIGEKETLGTLSLDTMVHPDYRRQGMFTKLADHLYERVAEAGIPLTYGFPNQNSYRGFVGSLGWVDLAGRLPLFVRLLRARPALESRLRLPGLAHLAGFVLDAASAVLAVRGRTRLPERYALRPVESFDERVDELWSRSSDKLEIALVRDARYLNWRYVGHPTEEYALFLVEGGGAVQAFLVLKTEERFGLKIGYIVDLLTAGDDPELDEGLIGEAVSFFRQREMDIVSCLMLEEAPYARPLRRHGFFVAPRRFLPQELYLGVKRHTDEYPSRYLEASRNWFVTWGDHDAV